MSDFSLEDRIWGRRQSIESLGGIELQVYIMQEGDSEPTQRQLNALGSFNGLSQGIAHEITSSAVRYFKRVESIGDLANEGVEIDLNNIEKHYAITSLLIPELQDCDSDFVFLSADCDWEPERGMQILFEDEHVIWCGEHGPAPFSPQWRRIIASPPESRTQQLRELLR